MARRAAYIEKIRKENTNVMVLDCGGMFNTQKKPAELRAATIAKAMGMMKYDSVNLSDEDLGFGIDFLRKLAVDNRLPMVSANIKIYDPADQKSFVKPFIIKEFKGFKVGITGLASPSFFNLSDPDKKNVVFSKDMNSDFVKTVDEIRSKADFVIGLTHLGYDSSVSFLESSDIKGLAIAISGHGRFLSTEPKKIKDTYLVQNSMSGEHLGVIRIKIGDKGRPESLMLEDVALLSDMPEEPNVMKLSKEFDKESITIEETERKNDKASEEQKATKELLKLKPEEFVKMMQGHEGQTVPLK